MILPDRNDTFTNRGVGHPLLRIPALLLLWLVLVVLFLLPIVALAARALRASPSAALESVQLDPASPYFVLGAWTNLAAGVLAVLLVTRLLDRQPFSVIGLRPHRGWATMLAWGAGLGGTLVLAAFLLLWALHLALPGPGMEGPARALALGAASLIPIAVMEEVVFRGYVLRNLAQKLPPWPALLLSGVLFAVVHGTNPQTTPTALVNVALAGLLIGYPYLRTGSLWLSLGLHFAWNYVLGPVLGMPVSGLGFPGVLHTPLRIPDWVSGGSFGPEGGIVATLVLLGGLAFLYRQLGPLASEEPDSRPGGRR